MRSASVEARGKGEDGTDGAETSDGSEGVEVVDALDLGKPLRDESRLVAHNAASGVPLHAEHPLVANHVGALSSSFIAASHFSQSGERRASARLRGSSPSASLTSATNAYSTAFSAAGGSSMSSTSTTDARWEPRVDGK